MKVIRKQGETIFKSDDGRILHDPVDIVKCLVEHEKEIRVRFEVEQEDYVDNHNVVLVTGSVITVLRSYDDLIVGYDVDDCGVAHSDLDAFRAKHVNLLVENVKIKLDEHLQQIKDGDFEEFSINLDS